MPQWGTWAIIAVAGAVGMFAIKNIFISAVVLIIAGVVILAVTGYITMPDFVEDW